MDICFRPEIVTQGHGIPRDPVLASLLSQCRTRLDSGSLTGIRRAALTRTTESSRPHRGTRGAREKRCWRTVEFLTTDLHLMPHGPSRATVTEASFHCGGRAECRDPPYLWGVCPKTTLQWMPEATDSTDSYKNCIDIVPHGYVLLYTFRPMVKFNLQSRHTKRVITVTTNKIENM